MGFFSTLWGSIGLLWGSASRHATTSYLRHVVPELRTLRGALVIEVGVFLVCIVPLAFFSNMSVKLILLELGAVTLTLTLLWLSLRHLITGVVVGTAIAGTERGVDTFGDALALPLRGIIEYARIVAAILASELAVGLIALWLPLHNNPLVSLLGLVVGTILVAYAIWQQGALGWPKIVWFTAIATLFIALMAILAPEASNALAEKIANSDALLKLIMGEEMSAQALLFTSIAMLIAVFAMLTLGSGFVRMLGLAVFLLYLPLFAQTVLAGWPEMGGATDGWLRQRKVAAVRKVDSSMPNSELAQRLIAALKEHTTKASDDAVKKITAIEKKAKKDGRLLTPSEITEVFEEYKLGAGVKKDVDEHIEKFRRENPGLFPEEAPPAPKEKPAPIAPPPPQSTRAPAPQQSLYLYPGQVWNWRAEMREGERLIKAYRNQPLERQALVTFASVSPGQKPSEYNWKRIGPPCAIEHLVERKSGPYGLEIKKEVIQVGPYGWENEADHPKLTGVSAIGFRPVGCEEITIAVKIWLPQS